MFTTTFAVILAITIIGSQVVQSTLTTRPSNIAVLLGSTATLTCVSSSGSSAIFWFEGTLSIVDNCNVLAAYTSTYDVNNTATGQCDLIIRTVASNNAVSYGCTDSPVPSRAMVTVLASTPSCDSNVTNPIPENSIASSLCNVSYTSPSGGPQAYIEWSTWCTAQPVINTTTFFESLATVIARRPTLQSCSGTIRFTAPPPQLNVANNTPSYSYSWPSPSNIPVSYCPTVTISPTQINGFQNTTILTCSSFAYPNVTTSDYEWTRITGSGEPNGQTYTVTSVGNYSIRCTATNYLLGNTSSPCSISATATGTTVASYCPSNILINETSDNTFSCSADASPPVSVYQWTFNETVIVSDDQTYTVPSGVNYTITCNVTNYLYNNTGNPCTRSASRNGTSKTVTTVETTPVSATVTQTTRTPDSSHTGGGTDTTAEGPTPSNKSLSAGAIAGIVVGIVVAAAIIIFALVFCLAPSCAANRECCMQRCKPGEKYKKSEPNAPSANTGNGRNPPNNQTNEMETISSTTYPQHPDHSHQYNQHQTGYEQGSQGLIYAEFTKPGESLTGIHNQPGSRKPVTPQEENPYAAVERA